MSSRRRSDGVTAYILLSPYLFIFLTFTLFAIGYTVYLSFTRYNLLRPPQWWGLEGWRRVLHNDLFIHKALPNTFKYVAIVVPVQTVLSLILAFAMDQKLRFRRLFRTIYYLPSITSSVVISLIFIWLFSPIGVVNQLLGLSINWLNDVRTAFYTIMLLNIYTTTGTLMLIFLAGLQEIPRELYEAAAIDGANRLQTFWYVTIPLLRPVIYFVVTVGVIGTFQVFDQIFVMTAGGPLDSTTTVAYVIYKWAFRDTSIKMGQAAVASIILTVIILIVTLLQRRVIEGSGSVAS
ncbi:MAG: sugar ABC transporter permease [Anaerolineae bacterium]|nr:MAG: sugar ABC transporter permease [Anaerolineae bacterium]